MSSIPIPEPTLSSRAMLCSLSISQWSASKHDRQASEEIAAHHGAQPDVGRYNKLLIPREKLAEVRKIAGEARREHYFMTLPWDDSGFRVLPAAVPGARRKAARVFPEVHGSRRGLCCAIR